MATVVGQRTTLSDTVGLAIDMSPVIQLIDPFDVGYLSYVGMGSLDKPATETEHKWREDSLRPITDALTGGINNSVTAIPVSNRENFRQWDLILIDDEVMQNVGTDTTGAGNLTVETRGTRSTAATHSSGATVQIIGTAMPEGSTTPRTARTTQQVSISNYTQIFEDVVEVSSTMEAVEQWSPGSEYARQLAKTMKSLFIIIDKALWYNKGHAGSASIPRSFNGTFHFLSQGSQPAAQRVDAGLAQLSEGMINSLLMSTYDNGGVVNCFFMTLVQKQAINKFLDPVRRIEYNATQAGALVDSYLWEQGVVDFVIDRWLGKDRFVALDSEYIGFGPLASEVLGHEVLPKLSRLAQRGQITGEYTFEFKSPKTSGYIFNLSQTIV